MFCVLLCYKDIDRMIEYIHDIHNMTLLEAKQGQMTPQMQPLIQVWQIYRVFIKYCVFSKDFRIFRTLACLCFALVFQCGYTHQAGRTPAMQQNWQSSEKSQHFKEKQYLMNTLYKRHWCSNILVRLFVLVTCLTTHKYRSSKQFWTCCISHNIER